jgi:pyruvate dehydrogenase E2 component (dihydrolipoamide acetyltransferase)
VRKLARDRGIRLEDVPGSGPRGRIRISDVEAFASGPAGAARGTEFAAAGALEERISMKGMRERIAAHLVEAVRHAPQVTVFDLFDVSEVVRARSMLADRPDGLKLTYLPFVVKAAVQALKAEPFANAEVDETRQEIVLKRAYHIGIATAIGDGLVVPVVRDADRLSLAELARTIADLAGRARERRSAPGELVGSTFTVTSFGGMPGSPLYATPIINYPETAILGIGRVEEQPRVVNGQIVPRHCMGVSFTFDHRVLDGEGAARFMAALRRYLEQPLELLLTLR